MRKIPSLKAGIHSSLQRRQTSQQRRRRSVVEGLEPRAMLSAVPQPAHVVIVMEENHDYSQVIGSSNAPYIKSLVQQGALMTSSTAITHPSEPNYLDLFSGSDQGVSGDPVPTNLPFTTPNLGAALLQTGHTFVSYSETLPYPGFDAVDQASQGNFGNYARRHNPAVNWTDPAKPSGNLANNVMPTSVNQPFTSFPTDFNQLPTVSFVVPNVADDMHDDPSPTGIQKADTWLQTNLSAYAQWAQKNNSLLIVTWDENDSSVGNHIATIFDGQMVKPGQYNEAINHFNVLRTIEDMYGLTPTGTGAAAASSITDVWNPPALSATGTPVTSTVGGTFTGTLATFTDTADPDTDPFDYSATIDWGDGHTDAGSVSHGAGGFTVTGTHSYATEGIHTATLTITDMNDNATATINPVVTADYPLNATASAVSATTGTTFSGAVATFTDADPAATASEFTATVNWGDTSTVTSASITAAGGTFSVAASHLYAQAGTDPLTITIKDVGGATATLTSQASVAAAADPNAIFVTAVYHDVLNRAPDSGGLQHWTNLLDQAQQAGTLASAVSSVALQFDHSAEYYQNFVIKPDYLSLLGRAADADGLQYWTTQMQNGLTDQQLEAGFIASAEFYATAGGTDSAWVAAAYQLLLGRAPDQPGKDYWNSQLANLEASGETAVQARSQVAVRIAQSQENNSNLINQDYFHYLGRAAEQDGLNHWLGQFAKGATNEDVIAGFTGSPEYYKDKTGVSL
jgi:hypothetical protein